MKQRVALPLPRSLAMALAFVIAACGGAAEPQVDISKGEIRVDLREHTIALTSNEVRAGEVTLVIRNRGGQAHDLVVIRADRPPDALPVDQQTQKASEERRVGGVDLVNPGKTSNLRLTLEPGRYVLICNVPTHYQLGMRTELTVR